MALFSDIGGALGLLLGATLLTLFEIAEFCLKLFNGLKRFGAQQQKAQTVIIKVHSSSHDEPKHNVFHDNSVSVEEMSNECGHAAKMLS